jgi:hypothetical protein
LKSLGDAHQEGIAFFVAHAIVDHFEIVEVDQQHGDRFPVAARRPEAMTEPVHEQRSIRQSRQSIMKGVVPKLLLQPNPFGEEQLFLIERERDGKENGSEQASKRKRGGDRRQEETPKGHAARHLRFGSLKKFPRIFHVLSVGTSGGKLQSISIFDEAI